MKQVFSKTLSLCGLLAVAGAMLLAGCGRNGKAGDVRFSTVEGKQYMMFPFEGDFPDTTYVRNSCSLVWPAPGVLSPEVEHELLLAYFGDSAASTFDESLREWMGTLQWWVDTVVPGYPLDTIDESQPFGEAELKSTVRRDSNLLTFDIFYSCYVPDAAHGFYTTSCLTVDLDKGRVVHLCDLVDTNLMGEAIARAVQDLEVNREVRECLFPEFQDVERMPLSHDFFIDSTRSCIVVNYGLYWIAPYACGIQSIVLPIFWLSKHVPLTPYAKELFGPGCSLD